MPRVCPKGLLSISLLPYSALGGMETQNIHRGKLCKVWSTAIWNMAFAGLKLAATPTVRILHLPSRAAPFPLGDQSAKGNSETKIGRTHGYCKVGCFALNTSVNEVIVLFCLEKGLGEVCSIPRLHCKCYCEFYTRVTVSLILIPSSLPCAGNSFSDKNLFQFVGEVQAYH